MRDLKELERVHLVDAGHCFLLTSQTLSPPLVGMHLEVVQLKFWLGHTTCKTLNLIGIRQFSLKYIKGIVLLPKSFSPRKMTAK
jgi:hypothetical protein